MDRPASERWINPIAALAVSRCERSRGLLGWVQVPLLLAGPAGLLFWQRPPWLAPVLHALLMGRLSDPTPGEAFALPVLVLPFLLLTTVGTVPRATLGVARERERRTLEPLLLTRLSPAAILWGELVQVLLPAALAGLALLPLLSLSYLLGGISVGNIVAAFGLLLLSQVGIGLGCLCLSCWCRRGVSALALGYLGLLLGVGGTMVTWAWARPGVGPAPGWLEVVLALNPVAALVNAVMPHRGIDLGFGIAPFAAVAAGENVVLSGLFFVLGAVGLRRR
jgi:ABC-type Na+ efflux pump permease subunit